MLEGDPNPNGVVMKTSLTIIAAALAVVAGVSAASATSRPTLAPAAKGGCTFARSHPSDWRANRTCTFAGADGLRWTVEDVRFHGTLFHLISRVSFAGDLRPVASSGNHVAR